MGYEDATKTAKYDIIVLLSTIHHVCQSTENAPAASWGTKHVSFIPEGLVAELAGVRQTSASFLLAASGHAEVTAAIGHL